MNDLVKEFGVINEEYNQMNEILAVANQAIENAKLVQTELKAKADLLVKLSGKSLVELEKEFKEEVAKIKLEEPKVVEGEIVETPKE